MSQPNQNLPTPSDAPEPRAGQPSVPVWFIILAFLALYWAMVYFDLHGGWFKPEIYAPFTSLAELDRVQPPPPNEDFPRQRAMKAYEATCSLCHGMDGMGKPGQAPSYVGSEWVLGSPNRLIRIPQHGLNGPIKVNGQTWTQPTSMAPMGAALSDEDLAYVLCYIRSSWGNKASIVTPEQVHTVREQTAKRTQPWTEPELLTIP